MAFHNFLSFFWTPFRLTYNNSSQIPYHSLEDTINRFFSGCSIPREKCDRNAAELTNKAVELVRLQGPFSYSVAAGQLFVQIYSFNPHSSINITEHPGIIYSKDWH